MTQQDAALRALGERLAARVGDCTEKTLRAIEEHEWVGRQASAGFAESRAETVFIANLLVARWLITGESMTQDEAGWLAQRGTIAAGEELSIVNVTRSYFIWRDVLTRCLEQEAAASGSPPAALETALRSVRAAADASIMRMARAYDEEERRLRAALLRQREDFRHLALHDPLTGIPNRLLLIDRLQQAINAARRDSGRVALLFVDLDRFKEVNDRFGHEAGDQVLKALAGRLVATVRASDTVARLGGDEFAVILPGCPSPEAGLQTAMKLVQALQEPVVVGAGGDCVVVGGSVGLALFPEHAADQNGLLREADTAMYRAKWAAAGRSELATGSVSLPA